MKRILKIYLLQHPNRKCCKKEIYQTAHSLVILDNYRCMCVARKETFCSLWHENVPR